MNEEELLSFRISAEAHVPSRELQGIQPGERFAVGRRSFIRGLGIVGATLLRASALLLTQGKAQAQSSGSLTLNVDLSWYTRYRSEENPDLGAIFKGPLNILNEPAIPLNDTDNPPTTMVPPPPIPGGSPFWYLN